MTGGGPANATHLFATYAYQIGIGTGILSEGAAISLAMFPILFLVVIIQLLYIRRVEVRLAMIDGAVSAIPAVPVLLDGDHLGAAGWRALPALEIDQLQSVLDLETDVGPCQV